MKLKDIPACLGVQDLTLAPRKQGGTHFYSSINIWKIKNYTYSSKNNNNNNKVEHIVWWNIEHGKLEQSTLVERSTAKK